MKKTYIIIAALVGLGLVAGAILYFMPKGGQKPGAKNTVMVAVTQRSIPQPLETTAGKDDVTLGQADKDGASLAIPKNSFSSSTDISLVTPDQIPAYDTSGVEMLGSPIQISAGQPVRLDDKATVTFKIPADQIPAADQADHLRVAYFDGTDWEYLKPENVDLKAGTVTFGTYHFSLFGLTKLKDNTKLTEDWIHSKALDDKLKENVNEVTNEIGKKAVDMTLKKMGIKGTYTAAVVGDLLKDDGYKSLYDQYQKGDVAGFNEKLQVLIGKKIAKNVPESAFKAALDGVLENKDDIAAVSKAAGYIAGGQYEDAAKIIGETISDKFLITTAGKVAIEVINHEIQTWKNAEVEAAYKAYKNGSNAVFYGYNVDKGDFDAVWDQMRGVGRQLAIEAIAQENATRHDSGMPPLTKDQEDRVRQEVKEAYQSQFESRLAQEDQISAEEQKLQKIMDAMTKAGIFDSTTGPVGLDKGFDFETKLDVLGHFVDKMMQDTNRFDLTDKTGLIADQAINVDDLVQGARLYFSGANGKQDYAKFLHDRFGISLSPALKDLAGTWSGQMTITDVVLSDEAKKMQEDAKNGKKTDDGCDFAMDFNALKGKQSAISFTLDATDESTGVLHLKNGKQTNDIPITYDQGVITGTFAQQGATANLSWNASQQDKGYAIDGSMDMDYKGLVKIKASVAATK